VPATIEVDGVGQVACEDGDTVLRACLRAGLGFPYGCNVGSCGNCRFTLLEGRVEHLRPDPPAWSDADAERGRWLGCQSAPSGNVRVKVRLDPTKVPPHPPARRIARLVDVTAVTGDISQFAFEIDGSDAFEPGQYALLWLPGVEGGRPYSMCNLPGSGQWRFLVRRVPDGEATTVLFDRLARGDQLTVDGPYGSAFLRLDLPDDLLLIAGGAGLSPILSIARAAVVEPRLAGRTLRFFYGGRRPRDLCAEPLLLGLSGFGERLHVVEAVSDPVPGWSGPGGFIHDVVRECLGPRIEGYQAYFAGPPPMVQATRRTLYEAGTAPDRMHFDEFF
jgi:toluene monooxygenase electron transfer component